ncbi:unnamed protein product [Rangifer tarandus platyrhynchus]|uniref:Uncharacterized protein n=1 Tax=Rangifer tarandus platyrhynchus TaxID=3082113 RepID=A0AC59Z2S8_RANTA
MAAAPEPGEPGKGKPFKLLGILDVENIPCAWDSILYVSLGSVVAGLGHFLLTSRIRRSCDIGVGGFIVQHRQGHGQFGWALRTAVVAVAISAPGLFWHLARLSLHTSGSSPQHCPTPRARDSEALRQPQPQPLQVSGAGRRGMKDIFNLH